MQLFSTVFDFWNEMHVPPQRVGDRARNGTKAVRTERPHVSVARVMATRPVKTDIQYNRTFAGPGSSPC